MKFIKIMVVLVAVMVLFPPVFTFPMSFLSSERSEEAIKRVRPMLEHELEQLGMKWGAPVFIRIFKKEKLLEIWARQADDRFVLFKKYNVCTYGPEGLGPKMREGDMRAPEGFYLVIPSKMNPNSNFHLSFNVGYPNSHDKAHGWTGGAIMVHGKCKSWGCFALWDKEIEEVYALVDAGFRHGQKDVQVHIFPFRMTTGNMKRYRGHIWESFWQNLKIGYDMFENDRYSLPVVTVHNKQYVFKKDMIDGGYGFARNSVRELGMNIIAEAWFVPEDNQYFSRYLRRDALRILAPYMESFRIVIEPVFQNYSRYHIVVKDRNDRVVEIVPNDTNGWRSIETAPDSLKRLIDQVCRQNFRKEKQVQDG